MRGNNSYIRMRWLVKCLQRFMCMCHLHTTAVASRPETANTTESQQNTNDVPRWSMMMPMMRRVVSSFQSCVQVWNDERSQESPHDQWCDEASGAFTLKLAADVIADSQKWEVWSRSDKLWVPIRACESHSWGCCWWRLRLPKMDQRSCLRFFFSMRTSSVRPSKGGG